MAVPVGTIVCPGCGAAIAKTAARCGYCGATVVLPAPAGAAGPAERRTFCPRCTQLYPASAGRCPRCPPGATDERGGHCPRCGGHLEPTAMGAAVVDRCPACRGHWFDGDEMEHAFDVTTEGASREEANSLRRALPRASPADEIRYLACVRCGERMARRQIAPRTGLIVDVCRPHGVWFDGDELDRFLAFVRAGGLEVLRHDGIAAAEARKRAATESGGAAALAREPLAHIGPPPDLWRTVRWLFRHL
jgi:Zn-finger nucleic acid-binding protein